MRALTIETRFLRHTAPKNHRGFTLIELIIVIVILGILAATAMPKFIDMRREARIAALQGLMGAVRSALISAQTAFQLTTTYPDWVKNKAGQAINKSPTNVDDFPLDFNGRRTTVRLVGLSSSNLAPPGVPLSSVTSPGAAFENHRGILTFLEGLDEDSCDRSVNYFSGQWDLLICPSGFNVAINNKDNTYFGIYFYPKGVLPPKGFDGNVTPQKSTQCFLRYATAYGANAISPTFEGNSGLAIELQTADC